jgi:hypothetical protein
VRYITKFFAVILPLSEHSILSIMASFASRAYSHALWICLYGPVLSFLPPRWRTSEFAQQYAGWKLSTYVSSFVECILGFDLFFFWFGGKLSHPFFLCLALYFFIDGAWRSLTAHSDGVAAGTVLLAVADEAYAAAGNSFFAHSHKIMPDLVTLDDLGNDWQLRIETSRAKRDWESSRIIRYGDRYFRLETCQRHQGPRPFIYLLRALEAGAPGHAVRTYYPETN